MLRLGVSERFEAAATNGRTRRRARLWPRRALQAALVTIVSGALLSVCHAGPDDGQRLQSSGAITAGMRGWVVYGGDSAADRYSPLRQINRRNVQCLRPVWRFDEPQPGDPETNPIIVGRTLFAYTPDLKVIALEAATGKLLWTFDPGIRGSGPHRGVAYWSDGRESRLLVGGMNHLFALDPANGKPIPSFGENGHVDLSSGLRDGAVDQYVSLTSPGIVYRDLLIVGFRTGETEPSPPGDIRAYDVRTGSLRWTFHTIPHPGEVGYESWPRGAWKTSGAANVWAGFALDESRGILYAPTGSAVSDFYGSDRLGNDLFANTLLALDAATGKRIWHFQAVHHDIWDRDLASQPSLLTLRRNGAVVDAVAQPTKQGYLFVFNRATGEPLFPIEEHAYPASDVPGEVSSPTQPRPVLPEPFTRQVLTEEDLTTRTSRAHAWALQQLRTFRSKGPFVPLAIGTPTVVFPGFDGGAEWGGAAVDPATGVVYINANEVAWTGSLVKRAAGVGLGRILYETRCASCHGIDRKGSPPQFPSLIDVGHRLSADQIADIIHTGRGRMPPFANMGIPGIGALLRYVLTGSDAFVHPEHTPMPHMDESLIDADDGRARYLFTGYDKFLDPDGYPATSPPWGTLNAIDLNTGRYLWRVPLGEYPELASQGLSPTGTENYGGPIVTGGGLLFIGATIYDHKLRAFDTRTGKTLWEERLPYSGTATPATYMIDGRQYVVIATSNARTPNAAQGAAYIAFALADEHCRRSPRRNAAVDARRFDELAAAALLAMKERAGELRITGVAVVAYFEGDSIHSWLSRMSVVGRLEDSPSQNTPGANLLAIAYSKAAEMADTLKDSGSHVRPPMAGEVGWPGGVIVRGRNGYLIAAFSGGEDADDLKISRAGVAALAKGL